MSAISVHEHLTRAEVEKAFSQLTSVQFRQLRRLANLYGTRLAGTIYSREDLFHEAVERTLSGARVWKDGIHLFAHLQQTMRSISDSWSRQFSSRQARLPPSDEVDSRGRFLAPDLERGVSVYNSGDGPPREDPRAVQLWNRVRARLQDRKAQVELQLLEGLAEGSRPLELRAALGLSQQAHESALKRIRRTATKFRREVS